MPFVPTVFTLLGRHQRYLAAALDALFAGPLPDVDTHASRTRRIGQAAAATLVRRPPRAQADAPAILALLERYNEANPRSLLVTTPLARDLARPSGVMESPLPAAPPGGDVDDVLADIRTCHGQFNLPGLWREFAHGWPGLLADAWLLVRALASASEFRSSRDAVLSLALETAAGCVAPSPADVGCDQREVLEINRILAWYQLVIATMIIEIECLRRAFGAGDAVEEG
jgi:hypothetical protein